MPHMTMTPQQIEQDREEFLTGYSGLAPVEEMIVLHNLDVQSIHWDCGGRDLLSDVICEIYEQFWCGKPNKAANLLHELVLSLHSSVEESSK
jgi:hypothetical protein